MKLKHLLLISANLICAVSYGAAAKAAEDPSESKITFTGLCLPAGGVHKPFAGYFPAAAGVHWKDLDQNSLGGSAAKAYTGTPLSCAFSAPLVPGDVSVTSVEYIARPRGSVPVFTTDSPEKISKMVQGGAIADGKMQYIVDVVAHTALTPSGSAKLMPEPSSRSLFGYSLSSFLPA